MNAGLQQAMRYPLFDAIIQRRSRRIGKGIRSVPAGDNTYEAIEPKPQPLTPLEEALLIVATGATGLTMPDRPFQDENGVSILGTPSINMIGRAAGSPDNAQATHFFLINDDGVYFLQRQPSVAIDVSSEDDLIGRAQSCKRLVRAGRPQFPREFPYYLDSNRFLSNLPGSTILFPVVDMTRQYINGLMYLLTEKDGHRPVFVDDRNFYLHAGVGRWIRDGFLNRKYKIPFGVLGPLRTQIEADLLLQNLALVIQAMGLGGWIHASIAPPYLMGNPHMATDKDRSQGLAFEWHTPPFRLLDLVRWGTFLPKVRAHPVGFKSGSEYLIQGLCPPYVTDMSAAVDAIIEQKNHIYGDRSYFQQIFQNDRGTNYVKEVPHYDPRVIACVKDVCNYIVAKHGRFPAHVDAIYVPGVWIQVHHLDLDYYDLLFKNGYTETQAKHQERWHS
jgi:hypothetical protein